ITVAAPDGTTRVHQQQVFLCELTQGPGKPASRQAQQQRQAGTQQATGDGPAPGGGGDDGTAHVLQSPRPGPARVTLPLQPSPRRFSSACTTFTRALRRNWSSALASTSGATPWM